MPLARGMRASPPRSQPVPPILAGPPPCSEHDTAVIKTIYAELNTTLTLVKQTGFPLPLNILTSILKVQPNLHHALPSLTPEDTQRVRASVYYGQTAPFHPRFGTGSPRSSLLSSQSALSHLSLASSIAQDQLEGQVSRHMVALISCFRGFCLRSMGQIDESRRAFALGMGVRMPVLKGLCETMSRETTRLVQALEPRVYEAIGRDVRTARPPTPPSPPPQTGNNQSTAICEFCFRSSGRDCNCEGSPRRGQVFDREMEQTVVEMLNANKTDGHPVSVDQGGSNANQGMDMSAREAVERNRTNYLPPLLTEELERNDSFATEMSDGPRVFSPVAREDTDMTIPSASPTIKVHDFGPSSVTIITPACTHAHHEQSGCIESRWSHTTAGSSNAGGTAYDEEDDLPSPPPSPPPKLEHSWYTPLGPPLTAADMENFPTIYTADPDVCDMGEVIPFLAVRIAQQEREEAEEAARNSSRDQGPTRGFTKPDGNFF